MADNVPEADAGLTEKEKDIVRQTWELVKKDINGNGYDLLIRFFTENPTYQQYFSFKDVPLAELRGNKKVLAHVKSLMYALTAVVDSLDDTDCLVEMLAKLASSHKTRGIAVDTFDNLGLTVLGHLAEKFPDLVNEEGTLAWKKTYGVIVKVVGDKYAESA
ncbi:Globin [Halotydeus destructor]|nr:Globin [Halotydeus destructor]